MTMDKEFVHTFTKKVSFTKGYTDMFILSTKVDFREFCKQGQITVPQYMHILDKLDYIQRTFDTLDKTSYFDSHMEELMHTADYILAVRQFVVATCPDRDEVERQMTRALKKRKEAKKAKKD